MPAHPVEPTPSDPPAPYSPRYNSLDIWRGISCLMIVMLHASFYAQYDPAPSGTLGRVGELILSVVSRMGLGVYLFFVISGYCIAATADATRRKGRASGEYFRRRLWRIFPPYWAALVLTLLLTWAVGAAGHPDILRSTGPIDTGCIPHASDLDAAQWFGNLTLTETWRHHFFGSPERKLLGPSWSLCYEEQFYVACGLFLLIAPSRFFTGVVVVTALTVGTTALHTTWQGPSPLGGFFFDGRWLLFAGGVCVYWYLATEQGRSVRATPVLLGLALGAVVVLRYAVLARVGAAEQKVAVFEVVVGLAFALALVGLRRWDATLASARLLQPFAFCGRMCYSLYLVHWPVTKLVTATCFMLGVRGVWPTLLIAVPLAVVASLVTSWWFHVLVERRFLNTARSPVPAPAAPPPAPEPDRPVALGAPCPAIG